MILVSRRRGEPLAVLALIVGGWIAGRAVLSEGALLPRGLAEPVSEFAAWERSARTRPLETSRTEPRVVPAGSRRALQAAAPPIGVVRIGRREIDGADLPSPPGRPLSAAPTVAPAFPAARLSPFAPPAQPRQTADARWSTDAWVLLRRDGSGGRLLSRYGASQAGAVVRYRLIPGDGHRPALYLRAAAALDGPRQREVATGLSVRPVAGLPVVAAAEFRVTSDGFGRRARPAIMAYTELAPFDLGAGIQGESYLQGGYVGGRGATAFIDGQVRLDRKLTHLGKGELRLGGGVWGGAQEGAARLDVGPSAMLAVPLSNNIHARASIDWRFRVAGNAAPGSGPALTLSAGF